MSIMYKRVIIKDESSPYFGEHGLIVHEPAVGRWLVELDLDGTLAEVNGMQFCFEVKAA